MFHEIPYRQKSGTAMGTNDEPTYASLVLGYHELKADDRTSEIYGNCFSCKINELGKRHLDGGFILWNERLDKLNAFQTSVNNINPRIKFNLKNSNKKRPILDKKQTNTELETDLYFKTSDSRRYLFLHLLTRKHSD